MPRLLHTLILLLFFVTVSRAQSPGLELATGDPFPDFKLTGLRAPQDFESLGLAETGTARLNDINADLLVLEFFNRFCFTCINQAPVLEEFFQRVVLEGDLKSRVKLLAVGVGNRQAGIDRFRSEHALTYPMLPDFHYEVFSALGDPGGTPFTIFLLRSDDGWTIGDFHMGGEGLLELSTRSRVLLSGRAAATKFTGRKIKGRETETVRLSGEEMFALAKKALSRIVGREVDAVKIEKGGLTDLYRAVGEDGEELELYARYASRRPVCDLCHENSFLFVFGGTGELKGFEPVYMTKFGNAVWTESDQKHFRSRLIGRTFTQLDFAPEVDSVTSASMSSSLVYDELRRTGKALGYDVR